MNVVASKKINDNLEKYFNQVCQDHDPLVISRENDENVVILSMEDYNSLVETQYLMSSKKTREKI